MRLSKVDGEIERFRASPSKYQQTFKTPLDDLHRFVATILSQFSLDEGVLTNELVVFEPEDLLLLLGRHSISPDSVPAEYFMHVTITATGQEEIAELLEAAFGCWVDFLFIPSPETFAIYADHDEWATFFASKESDLSLLTAALVGSGFSAISHYVRDL